VVSTCGLGMQAVDWAPTHHQEDPVTTAPDGQRGIAERLGVKPGSLVQSIGDGEGEGPAADAELLVEVADAAGEALVPEGTDDVLDMVLLWWRADDGDLVDALVDARRNLDDSGVLWLLTPKTGRPGHVPASDVQEAAPTAGLSQTSTVSATAAWSGIRLVAPKAARARTR